MSKVTDRTQRGLDAPIVSQMAPRPGWEQDSVCSTEDWQLFWADESGCYAKSALDVCAACPVRVDCLLFSLGQEIVSGEPLYGGMTPGARREFARRHPSLVTYRPAETGGRKHRRLAA